MSDPIEGAFERAGWDDLSPEAQELFMAQARARLVRAQLRYQRDQKLKARRRAHAKTVRKARAVNRQKTWKKSRRNWTGSKRGTIS